MISLKTTMLTTLLLLKLLVTLIVILAVLGLSPLIIGTVLVRGVLIGYNVRKKRQAAKAAAKGNKYGSRGTWMHNESVRWSRRDGTPSDPRLYED